jgi:hypothetical protein
MEIELRRLRRARAGGLLLVGGAIAALFLSPGTAEAQGIRGWVGSTVQAVQLRPLALDTVDVAALTQEPDGTLTFMGQPVACVTADVCTMYVPAPEETAVAATQDVSLTAWGLGLQGLSFTTLLRGRAKGGGDLVWPRADDSFDLMLGYAQLHRGTVRVRLGRQEVRSGLGFPAFDGAFAAWAVGRFVLEGYGGRSMARGLREPTHDALRGLESFIPDESVYLIGGAAHGRFTATTFTARYQREILADRSGLVSERASVDFNSVFTGARVSGSLDYDFAFEHVGKGHLTLSLPMDEGRWLVEASGRRYVPYFELSTIWGFFEPVSYSEAELRTAWSPRSTLGLWVSGGWRTYEETGATTVFRPLRDDGWRANSGARWQVKPGVTLDGSYSLEWGPGSFLSSGDLALRLDPVERFSLTLQGTTFQQIEEFRIGDGRALGMGLSFDYQVGDRTTFMGGASMLRHRDGGTTTLSPWNQGRAWSALRIDVGSDPGLSQRRNRR